MNFQNIMSQLQVASNPLQMLMSTLNPNQKQTLDLFKNKPTQEQAEEIARICNEKGLSKADLEQIVQLFKTK